MLTPVSMAFIDTTVDNILTMSLTIILNKNFYIVAPVV